MKLPNVEHAAVDERKLRDYLLSSSHPIGRFKAAFFQNLGFSSENWAELAAQLKKVAQEGDVELSTTTKYGRKYVVFGTIVGKQGESAEVVTIWILLDDDDKPRLVTVYPR